MALLLVPVGSLWGQGIMDALRYSQDNSQGTARFNAMSGAFSALGGDMSAIAFNPAGSAVFLQNQVSISTGIYSLKQETNYFGSVVDRSNIDFLISNAGGVFVFDNYNEDSPWKKFVAAITYNQSGSFENELWVSGSTPNSIGNFFVARANGIPLNLLQTQSGESISDLYSYLGSTQGTKAQDAFLGYQGFIIDPLVDDPSNETYVSNTGSGSFNQDFRSYAEGYMGKYTLNLSTQYTDNLYFGLNLNTHAIEYQEATVLIEQNSNENSSVKNIRFENYLSVLGDGFSFQLGGIAKVDESWRFSLTYDSPIWLTISEETSQYLDSNRIVDGVSTSTVVDPRIINVFSDYRLRTPGKIGAGAAYVFGTSGLISFDYGYKDFGSMKFSPSNLAHFSNQNDAISTELGGSSTYRIGGEYRWNELRLRGGYFLEESPYANTDVLGDRTGFSLGAGYSTADFSIDFSYSQANREEQQSLFLGNNQFQNDTSLQNYILTLNLNL